MRVILVLVGLLYMTGLTLGQTEAPELPPNNEEMQLFRGLLDFHKIEPEVLDRIAEGYDYSKLIVIVLGDPNSPQVVTTCRSALGNGGAVLIACDKQIQLDGYFPRGGEVRIAGGTVRFRDPNAVDNRKANRPLAFPLSGLGPNPFSDVRAVATLDTSYLLYPRLPPGIPIKPVATFTTGATVATETGLELSTLDVVRLPFALATVDDSSPTRCMVLADPDVFSNRMIFTSGRADNPTDNLKFANNTVLWLKGSGRSKCVFIENGEAVTKFDEFKFSSIPVSPPIPPLPPPNPNGLWEKLLDPEVQRNITDKANAVVDEAQRNDVANRGILSAAGGQLRVILAVLAGVLLAIVYLIVRRRAVRDFYRKTFRPIPKDPAMLGPDVPVGSMGHRRLELLRSADYGPVLRPVVRQLFQDRGLPVEYLGDKLPPLDIAVRRPQFLREAIHSLWAVVRGSAPVAYGRWKQLEPQLAAVRAAADDDRWRFVAPSP